LGKNAVLIVEFAVQRHRSGETVLRAAMQGAALRFRPILMTSFAFIAGLIPLMFASGPGAIGNRTIGSASAGGMLLGTLFGVLIIPGLYYIFGGMSERKPFVDEEDENPLTEQIDNYTEKMELYAEEA
jgi:HAE1 family hydrophobic/amphiphilic exporter-1